MIRAYIIRCLTNLHAGSNGESHAIIDKIVQRDVSTGFPTIHSSSLKGSLRQFFESKYGEADPRLTRIFGAPPKRNDGDEQKGAYTFFSAQLLSFPVRSDKRPFYRTSSPALINDLLAFKRVYGFPLSDEMTQALRNFRNLNEAFLLEGEIGNAILEDFPAKPYPDFEQFSVLQELLDEHIAILPDKNFLQLTQNLPVIARNQLENGVSQNLWYEEVVPRQTRFFTLMSVPDNDPDFNCFEQTLCGSNIQIGGNATIGYGQVRFSKIKEK